MPGGARAHLAENPFYVLALATDCTRLDVERTGTKLLGMLELGLASARTYATPVGPRERTVELVRGAMAELRDPARRAVHELWAALPADEPSPLDDADESAPPFADALAIFGWRR